MNNPKRWAVTSSLAVSILVCGGSFQQALAEVFKCIADDGSVTYQATDCAANQAKTTIQIDIAPSAEGSEYSTNTSAADQVNQALAIHSSSRSIQRGIVTAGMNASDVVAAWGNPTRRSSETTNIVSGPIVTELWEWDYEKKEARTNRNCRTVSTSGSSIPRDIKRHIPSGVTTGRMCNPTREDYTVFVTRYVTFMDGVVTHVEK